MCHKSKTRGVRDDVVYCDTRFAKNKAMCLSKICAYFLVFVAEKLIILWVLFGFYFLYHTIPLLLHFVLTIFHFKRSIVQNHNDTAKLPTPVFQI